MFKKLLKKSIILFMLLGIIVSIVSFSDYVFAYRDEHDPGGGGSGTWNRWKEQCPNDPNKWEYHCEEGGSEMCSITNC